MARMVWEGQGQGWCGLWWLWLTLWWWWWGGRKVRPVCCGLWRAHTHLAVCLPLHLSHWLSPPSSPSSCCSLAIEASHFVTVTPVLIQPYPEQTPFRLTSILDKSHIALTLFWLSAILTQSHPNSTTSKLKHVLTQSYSDSTSSWLRLIPTQPPHSDSTPTGFTSPCLHSPGWIEATCTPDLHWWVTHKNTSCCLSVA